MQKKSLKTYILLFAVILFAVFLGYAFIHAAVIHSFIHGDDIMTHMQRVEGMIASWRAGHIPAKLHFDKAEIFIFLRNNIDFSDSAEKIPPDNSIAFLLQKG